MNRSINAAAAGLVATLALGLVGCSGGETTVKGRRDDIRHLPKLQHTATRTVTDYRQQCTSKTRPVTSGSGLKKTTGTRTYQDCTKVRAGSHTESYPKVDREERYCVELDDVNGKRSADDVWFTVSSATYWKAARKHEGDKFKMSYYHKGC